MGLFDLFRAKPAASQDEDYIVPNTIICQPVNRRARPRNNARHGTQVLIIDGHEVFAYELEKTLKTVKYQTLIAADAESGLEIARDERPKLIFLEVVLPGMHGFSALRKIRRDPELCDTPVILMSASNKAAQHFYSNSIEADDFMRKPFTREEIFLRIDRLVDRSGVLRRISPEQVKA